MNRDFSKEDLQMAYRYMKSSLVAQLVKNLPAVQETQVQFLGWEDPWRRKWQPTPILLPGESHGQRSLASYSPWGHKSQTQLSERQCNRHMERCLISLIIREMQTKPIMNYHLTFVRRWQIFLLSYYQNFPIIKKTASNKCWPECEEKGTLLHHWWECKLVQPMWKRLWWWFNC